MKILMKFAILAGFAGVLHYALSSFPKLKTPEADQTIAKISVATQDEMDALFDYLDKVMDTYGFVTVADLYDFVGVVATFIDDKYGWDDLTAMTYVRDRNKYTIQFPPVVPWKRPVKSNSK